MKEKGTKKSSELTIVYFPGEELTLDLKLSKVGSLDEDTDTFSESDSETAGERQLLEIVPLQQLPMSGEMPSFPLVSE